MEFDNTTQTLEFNLQYSDLLLGGLVVATEG